MFWGALLLLGACDDEGSRSGTKDLGSDPATDANLGLQDGALDLGPLPDLRPIPDLLSEKDYALLELPFLDSEAELDLAPLPDLSGSDAELDSATLDLSSLLDLRPLPDHPSFDMEPDRAPLDLEIPDSVPSPDLLLLDRASPPDLLLDQASPPDLLLDQAALDLAPLQDLEPLDLAPLQDLEPLDLSLDLETLDLNALPDLIPDALPDLIPDMLPDALPDLAPDALISLPHEPNCDTLNPLSCGLPWPSDRWLQVDEGQESGFRLEYSAEALPINRHGISMDPAPYRRLDGFSPSTQIITLFSEPAVLGEFEGPEQIERSLEPSFPTLLLDLETGERIPHWIENDARSEIFGRVLLFIRPATRLESNHRYGVAIRGLMGESGEPLAPSETFLALRQRQPSGIPSLEARRPSYELLFDSLEEAGLPRRDLQAAWWFHTESQNSLQGDLLAMREDALMHLGEEGIACQIENIEENFSPTGLRLIQGTVSTPWYMSAPNLPAQLVRDEVGRPLYQRDQEVLFTAVIPRSLQERSGPLIIWGHGLFGEADSSIRSEALVSAAARFGAVMAGTDWAGMSQHDLSFLATALSNASEFYKVGEMLQQSMINQIALTRTLMGRCQDHPAFSGEQGSFIQEVEPYFLGGSQGSILGGTFLTLSPDIHRGALIVGGAGFSFMIERSVHFNYFELLLRDYSPRKNKALLMALSQQIWDRAESATYLGQSLEGLPGIGPKEFIYLIAENDAQVPNLSSHRAARLAGLPVLSQSSHLPWGLPVVDSPHQGSAYIALDLGDRSPPPGNRSPEVDDGGHVNLAFTEEGWSLISHFLRTGEVLVPCDGICDLSSP